MKTSTHYVGLSFSVVLVLAAMSHVA